MERYSRVKCPRAKAREMIQRALDEMGVGRGAAAARAAGVDSQRFVQKYGERLLAAASTEDALLSGAFRDTLPGLGEVCCPAQSAGARPMRGSDARLLFGILFDAEVDLWRASEGLPEATHTVLELV